MIIQINNEDWHSADYPEGALLNALNRATDSHWQLVCPIIAIECSEPHRSCCIKKDSRHLLRRAFEARKGRGSTEKALQAKSEINMNVAPDLLQDDQQLQLTVELIHPFS